MNKIRLAALLALAALGILPALGQGLDSLPPAQLKAWRLTDDFFGPDSVAADTSSARAHWRYNPVLEHPHALHTGNTGGPFVGGFFFDRPSLVGQDFLFGQGLEGYFSRAERTAFVNTTRPLTRVDFSSTARSVGEETLGLEHSQNFNSRINAGLRYRYWNGPGQYLRQQNVVNDLAFFGSAQLPRYQAHLTAHRGRANLAENGGLRDTSFNFEIRADAFPVELEQSRSHLRDGQVFLDQRWGRLPAAADSLPDSLAHRGLRAPSLSHRLAWSRQSRSFSSDQDEGFYPAQYLSREGTRDSVFYARLANHLQLATAPAALRLGIRLEHERFWHWNFPGYGSLPLAGAKALPTEPLPSQTSTGDRPPEHFDNLSLAASARLLVWRGQSLGASARYFWGGYRQGDWELQARLETRLDLPGGPWRLAADFEQRRVMPNVLANRYRSNHRDWANDFERSWVNELGARLELPKWGLEAEARTALLGGWIYAWQEQPGASELRQAGQAVSVSAFRLRLPLRWGILHWDNRLDLQFSSDAAAVSVPLWAAYSGLSARGWVFKRAAYLVVGAEARAHQAYHAPSYDAATGLFHNQSHTKIQSYPVIDLYLNMKVRGLTFFVKMEHTNGLLAQDWHYGLPFQPIAPATFKFGFSWSFDN